MFVYLFNDLAHRAAQKAWANPTGGDVRGCDSRGCGEFGASRGARVHDGADYVATPGQDVAAVQS